MVVGYERNLCSFYVLIKEGIKILIFLKEREKMVRAEAEKYITQQDTENQRLKTELKEVSISQILTYLSPRIRDGCRIFL